MWYMAIYKQGSAMFNKNKFLRYLMYVIRRDYKLGEKIGFAYGNMVTVFVWIEVSTNNDNSE